jgi:hypothetical protein
MIGAGRGNCAVRAHPGLKLLLRAKVASTLVRRRNRVQAMADKSEALRDVEYFNTLIANETDENRRVVLLRLLEEAEKLRQEQEEAERQTKGA